MMRHPLHPALVHFPIACWTLSVITDLASLYFGETAWQWSTGLLSIGCGTALLAMMAGLMELSRIPEGPALRDTWLHMGAMSVALACFSARLLLRLDQLQALPPNVLSLVLDAAGFIALSIGGWLGGRLVYEHGVGRN